MRICTNGKLHRGLRDVQTYSTKVYTLTPAT